MVPSASTRSLRLKRDRSQADPVSKTASFSWRAQLLNSRFQCRKEAVLLRMKETKVITIATAQCTTYPRTTLCIMRARSFSRVRFTSIRVLLKIWAFEQLSRGCRMEGLTLSLQDPKGLSTGKTLLRTETVELRKASQPIALRFLWPLRLLTTSFTRSRPSAD